MKIKYVVLISVCLIALKSYGEGSGTNDINAFVKACVSTYNLGGPYQTLISGVIHRYIEGDLISKNG